jgi:hypothetical protein
MCRFAAKRPQIAKDFAPVSTGHELVELENGQRMNVEP